MTSPDETLPAGGTGSSAGGWPAKAAGQVEAFVAIVRDKTVRPVLTVVQITVFGIVAMFMLLVAVVLFSVGILRLLDVLVFHRHVWASYTVLGGMFSLVGLFLLSRRNPAS